MSVHIDIFPHSAKTSVQVRRHDNWATIRLAWPDRGDGVTIYTEGDEQTDEIIQAIVAGLEKYVKGGQDGDD